MLFRIKHHFRPSVTRTTDNFCTTQLIFACLSMTEHFMECELFDQLVDSSLTRSTRPVG